MDVLKSLSGQRQSRGDTLGCLAVDLSQAQDAHFTCEAIVVILDGVEEAGFGLAEVCRRKAWVDHHIFKKQMAIGSRPT